MNFQLRYEMLVSFDEKCQHSKLLMYTQRPRSGISKLQVFSNVPITYIGPICVTKDFNNTPTDLTLVLLSQSRRSSHILLYVSIMCKISQDVCPYGHTLYPK